MFFAARTKRSNNDDDDDDNSNNDDDDDDDDDDDINNNSTTFGRGDDTVGNPHRAQIVQFELSELILLSTLDKQLPVEQFEATVSQSTVPSPPETSVRQLTA